MPSIHRVERSPFWYASYYKPDGRRTLRSTGTKDKRKGLGIALEWDKASRLARQGRLTERRSREAIAACYRIAHQDELPNQTVREYLTSWLEDKEGTVADRSFPEYRNVVHSFLIFLKGRSNEAMDTITVQDIRRYQRNKVKKVSPGTVNKQVKMLANAWKSAAREQIIHDNIFNQVDLLVMEPGKTKRRPFTLSEIKRILNVASRDWKGMILVGLYSGMRLRDIADLTFQELDIAEGVIRKTTAKTGRTVEIPLAPPVLDYLAELPVPESSEAHVFTSLFVHSSSTLSGQFAAILVDAGLAIKKSHHGTGKGRNTRRGTNPLSFHCLRHTATSWLKNAGVSDVIARDIIGHDTEAISRVYTHIDINSKRAAIGRLPDVRTEN